jgi:RNA polymerase sigma-70 factor (ECF subfamily)
MDESMLLTDSAEVNGDLLDPHRAELLVHCYRMLGTFDEAEDAVQDTFARAWQRRHTYRRSISFRAWLYRIATNVCLDAIERRKRLPGETRMAIDPFPDRLLTGVAPSEIEPEARYDARESISLAFLTVLQVLPPRQRAVLLLRDVLTLRSSEVAELLDMSVPAVNSALQRARATLRHRYRRPRPSSVTAAAEGRKLRNLLVRYVRAWETSDVAGLVALLREDAVLNMPPMPSVVGARSIGTFLAESIFTGPPMRLLDTRSNGAPALAAYVQEPTGTRFIPFALLVIAHHDAWITSIDAFAKPTMFARFDLPMELAD